MRKQMSFVLVILTYVPVFSGNVYVKNDTNGKLYLQYSSNCINGHHRGPASEILPHTALDRHHSSCNFGNIIISDEGGGTILHHPYAYVEKINCKVVNVNGRNEIVCSPKLCRHVPEGHNIGGCYWTGEWKNSEIEGQMPTELSNPTNPAPVIDEVP
jgi:hypothetical protein